jgi:DNA-binding GntR family transcriptional regulator
VQIWNTMLVDVRAQIAISLIVPEFHQFVKIHEEILAALKASNGVLAGQRLHSMMEDLIERLDQVEQAV